jgi:hypothetical protein
MVPSERKPAKRTAVQGKAAMRLPKAMTGRASPAKAAVGDGWCFCCGGFAGHVKLMFVNGTALTPVPPVTPVAMGKSTRGVELKAVDDVDERQFAAWMKQVAAVPGVGGKQR